MKPIRRLKTADTPDLLDELVDRDELIQRLAGFIGDALNDGVFEGKLRSQEALELVREARRAVAK